MIEHTGILYTCNLCKFTAAMVIAYGRTDGEASLPPALEHPCPSCGEDMEIGRRMTDQEIAEAMADTPMSGVAWSRDGMQALVDQAAMDVGGLLGDSRLAGPLSPGVTGSPGLLYQCASCQEHYWMLSDVGPIPGGLVPPGALGQRCGHCGGEPPVFVRPMTVEEGQTARATLGVD